jgi:hypothetical protein
LPTIFFVNLSAILSLAALFTFVVNAASLVLFPLAVVGSQPSFLLLFRFAAGHASAVFLASVFTFFAVFALAGLLMALLPPSLFPRISLSARFIIGLALLALLASSFTVPDFLDQVSFAARHRVGMMPPVWFLGISQAVWGRGRDPFYFSMKINALVALGSAVLVGAAAYTLSFRWSFIRIPETAQAGPFLHKPFLVSPSAVLDRTILRVPSQRACYHFIVRTLLRSDGHLQIVLSFAALALVAVAQTLSSVTSISSISTGPIPSVEFLSIPFIVSYCIIIGVRLAFEIPSDLRANWIFRFWLAPDDRQARPIARRILLVFIFPWLIPLCFVVTLKFFGWTNALLHTAILIVSDVMLVEIALINFRKIPFTCSYPIFRSHSGLILAAYLLGFFAFTDYIPAVEHWSLPSFLRAGCFAAFAAIVLAALHAYRKQMLEMDKQLIFEETSVSHF